MPTDNQQIHVIKGVKGAVGSVTGTVKVVSSIGDANRLVNGYILVIKACSPLVEPLVIVASGVITDYGHIACDASIICRKYGIPVVVGTKIATKELKDGMKIELDSGKGTIKIL